MVQVWHQPVGGGTQFAGGREEGNGLKTWLLQKMCGVAVVAVVDLLAPDSARFYHNLSSLSLRGKCGSKAA